MTPKSCQNPTFYDQSNNWFWMVYNWLLVLKTNTTDNRINRLFLYNLTEEPEEIQCSLYCGWWWISATHHWLNSSKAEESDYSQHREHSSCIWNQWSSHAEGYFCVQLWDRTQTSYWFAEIQWKKKKDNNPNKRSPTETRDSRSRNAEIEDWRTTYQTAVLVWQKFQKLASLKKWWYGESATTWQWKGRKEESNCHTEKCHQIIWGTDRRQQKIETEQSTSQKDTRKQMWQCTWWRICIHRATWGNKRFAHRWPDTQRSSAAKITSEVHTPHKWTK